MTEPISFVPPDQTNGTEETPEAHYEEFLQLRNAKIITLVVLGVASLICSFIPKIISKCSKSAEFLFSVLNSLSGGVVVGAAFFHLLPDSTAALESYFNDHYPYAGLFATSGLFLLWVIERVLLADSQHNHSPFADETTPIVNQESKKHKKEKHNEAHGHHHHHHHDLVHNHYTEHEAETEHGHSVVDAYVFLIAVSVHSILEGLGLGADDTYKTFISTIVAVASHKALEAFALGLTIHRAKFKNLHTIILLVLYSLATPIGGAVGMIVGSVTSVSGAKLTTGILIALATGSFLYISLLEMLPAELNRPNPRPRRVILLLAMLAGWAAMAVVAKFSHGEEGHH